MSEKENPFKPPASAVVDQETEPDATRNPGIVWILLTLLVVAINFFLKFSYAADANRSNIEGLIGYAIGGAIGPPLLIVLLFQFGKDFRNNPTRLKIFFWMSVLGFLTTLNLMRG